MCRALRQKKLSLAWYFRWKNAISSVSGIDEITVYSSEGFADIACTFVLERDIDGAAQDIREKVAAAVNRLPRARLPWLSPNKTRSPIRFLRCS